MKDEIVIGQACAGQVRIRSARTTNLCEEASQKHHCMPTSSAALGRVLTITSIMASELKDEKAKVTCVLNGGGPAGTVLAQGNGKGEIKGFIGDPNIYMVRNDGHLAVGTAIGTNGTLTVTKDLGLKEPFSGVVNLQTGEIGEDFAYYFTVSEQTPSAVSVGVLVDNENHIEQAGGIIFQLLPNATEAAIEACEKVASTMPTMTTLLSQGKTIEQIILELFPDAEIMEHRDVVYHCGCDKNHYGDALATLPTTDLKEMIEEGKPIEIKCQYCNKTYDFSTDELKEILDSKTCGKSAQ